MPREYVETAGGVSPPISPYIPDPAKQDPDDPGRRGKRKTMERYRKKMRKGRRSSY